MFVGSFVSCKINFLFFYCNVKLLNILCQGYKKRDDIEFSWSSNYRGTNINIVFDVSSTTPERRGAVA